MDEYASLSHAKWECKYHVVFIPKCRRKLLYAQLRKYLGEVFHQLAQQKESRIEEGHLMSDHVHMMIAIRKHQRPIAEVEWNQCWGNQFEARNLLRQQVRSLEGGGSPRRTGPRRQTIVIVSGACGEETAPIMDEAWACGFDGGRRGHRLTGCWAVPFHPRSRSPGRAEPMRQERVAQAHALQQQAEAAADCVFAFLHSVLAQVEE